MRFSKAILFSAATLTLTVVGHAATISPSLTLSMAGMNFNQFSCSLSGEGSTFPTSCGSIDVEAINHPGNGIQISSGFTAFPSSFGDVTIDYHVSSAAGIDMVGLDFNGSFYGHAISSITESVYSGAGQQVGSAEVSCSTVALGGCHQTDNIVLNGLYHDLYLQKDIRVSSFLGESQISYVDQTFSPGSGTPFSATPEAGSFAMLGTGLLAAGLLRRFAKSLAPKPVKT